MLLERVLAHPVQPHTVRLRIYPAEGGAFLVTEERGGAHAVISTLGVFDSRAAADARVEGRVRELQGQRYRPAS